MKNSLSAFFTVIGAIIMGIFGFVIVAVGFVVTLLLGIFLATLKILCFIIPIVIVCYLIYCAIPFVLPLL